MAKFFLTSLKGFALGVSMVLPGISGGTIAFVMGIYEKLIQEISSFKIKHLKNLILCFSLKKTQLKKNLSILKNSWDWPFLTPLLIGMIIALALFISWAGDFINQYSFEFYSIIFGLILGSVISTLQQAQKSFSFFLFLFCSSLLNFSIFAFGSELVTIPKEISNLIFLPAGFLVSMALIVPGISGSYLLLVLGLYEQTLFALKSLDFFVISLFTVGALLGFLSTAKLIQKMLKKYWNQSLAVILGLMLSSLYAIYPLEKSSFSDFLLFNKNHALFLIYTLAGFFCLLAFHFMFFSRQKEKHLETTT
ncbi:MAG: DUF368 domain-containing protein [Oligoflexia bacterium]|nr:DUF368 domain-containing protein [Oligoflexia bacterium]